MNIVMKKPYRLIIAEDHTILREGQVFQDIKKGTTQTIPFRQTDW